MTYLSKDETVSMPDDDTLKAILEFGRTKRFWASILLTCLIGAACTIPTIRLLQAFVASAAQTTTLLTRTAWTFGVWLGLAITTLIAFFTFCRVAAPIYIIHLVRKQLSEKQHE